MKLAKDGGGGLSTITLPSGKVAFRKAAVMSSEAMALLEEEAPQDRMNLNMVSVEIRS